jgi:hypothetical protein
VVQIYLFSTGRINQREIEWLRVRVCAHTTNREQPIGAVISSDGWKPQKLMTFGCFIINNISNGAGRREQKRRKKKNSGKTNSMACSAAAWILVWWTFDLCRLTSAASISIFQVLIWSMTGSLPA